MTCPAQVRNAHSGAALTAASSFFPLSSFPIPPKLLLSSSPASLRSCPSSLPLALNASASVVGSLLALSRASANNFADAFRPATNMALILAPFGLDGAPAFFTCAAALFAASTILPRNVAISSRPVVRSVTDASAVVSASLCSEIDRWYFCTATQNFGAHFAGATVAACAVPNDAATRPVTRHAVTRALRNIVTSCRFTRGQQSPHAIDPDREQERR